MAFYLREKWWPNRAANEIAGFDKADSNFRVDVSSAVAAIVCAWQRHWASPDFGTNTGEGDFVTSALTYLADPQSTGSPFVIGWWGRPGPTGRLPVVLRPATIVSVLAEGVVLRGYHANTHKSVRPSCISLHALTPATDWCGPHAEA